MQDDNCDPVKSEKFDKEFKALVKQARDVIMAKDGFNIKLGKPNIILNQLTKYEQVYKLTEPQDHYEYFENIYKRYKKEALNTLNSDKWLKDESIVIQWGEGVAGVSKQNRIMLSAIYRKACELRDDAEARIEQTSKYNDEEVDEPDLNRPEILQLHLFRIFALLASPFDTDKLKSIVDELEIRLLIKEGDSPAPTNPTDGLSGLMNFANNMLGQMGVQPPPGTTLPNENDLSNILGTVFSNPQIKTVFNNILSNVNQSNDIGQVIGNLMGQLQNPQLTEVLAESVKSTTAIAANMGAQENATCSEGVCASTSGDTPPPVV